MTVITDVELNSYVTAGMSSLIADKELQTRSHQMCVQFKNVLSGTLPKFRQKKFVVPRDCYVDTVYAYVDASAGPYLVTVNVTGDGALTNWPIEMRQYVTTTSNFARSWFNNTQTKYGDRGFRVFPQGSTITVTVSSEQPSGSNTLAIGFVFRQFYGR